MAMLGYALVMGLLVRRVTRVEPPATLITIAPDRLPPTPKPKPARMRKAAGAASPSNIRNKAAEVVAPFVAPKPLPPIPAAIVAGVGAAASNGASDRPGPGSGAGGQGNGSGSGGAGDGEGDGGYTPPFQIKGSLSFSDLPEALRATGVEGVVGVRYHIEANGRVSDCAITRSSGSESLDQNTCALIQRRFRFDPSRDPQGHPIRATLVETHSWLTDRNGRGTP
ncbi:energy transducer TonB [Sphingomonas bacterium]|uniref:energy transducer TonB n=1 Tax=Sphingomonas bacterium TaxID=1895847 RepID=UPI0020C624CC|nr:energy transducer TonB [Sphingomonas bacterium]